MRKIEIEKTIGDLFFGTALWSKVVDGKSHEFSPDFQVLCVRNI